MAKRFNRTFELTDGKTTRKACFRIPNTETGTKITLLASNVENDKTGEVAVEYTKIAASHLVLLADNNTAIEQEVSELKELDYIFENPFLGVRLMQEFTRDINPLLQPSIISSPLSEEGKQS